MILVVMGVAQAQQQPRSAYVRPPHADNGAPWPAKSGYVKGYRRLNADGHSTITIDNTKNGSDVFARIYSLDAVQPQPVRVVFVRAHDAYTLKQMRPGVYDVRYRELDSGALKRSDPIGLDEKRTETEIQYTDLVITLYRKPGGTYQMHEMSEAEFRR